MNIYPEHNKIKDMTSIKDFLSSNSEDPKMESYSEKIISKKIENDRRKKWEEILEQQYQIKREGNSKVKSFSIRPWISIAASLLVLVGAFYFINNSTSTKSISELAHLEIQELQIMADQTVMRKGEADVDELRKSANLFYVEGEYAKALENWHVLSSGQKTIQSDFLYMGICYLKLGDSQQALKQLEKIDSPKGFELEWRWVSALACLDSNAKEKAHTHLSKLISEGKYKVAEAKKLLAAM